jgi:hypothetical protein
MLFPPSLPQAVQLRAFRAANGELGILPSDAMAFLDSCQADRIEVLGWDLWLVNYRSQPSGELMPAPGSWSGLIPVEGERVPCVFAASGDLSQTRREIGELKFDGIERRWLDHLRINFTLTV